MKLNCLAFISAAFLFCSQVTYAQTASVCKPHAEGATQLIEIRPRFHTVGPNVAEFDPCHRSVEFRVPTKLFGKPLDTKPPLVIIAHGGGGAGILEKNMVTALHQNNIATLLFDAYQMNGFYQGYPFWGSQATNESRQRMIYKAALGAYQWSLTQSEKVDTSSIYLQGVSNGAAVVTNLASVVDPQHVKLVFAEGLPGMGIGLPDTLAVPVRLIYGSLDNYGGKHATDWMSDRTEPCRINAYVRWIPEGNAKECNGRKNPEAQTEKPVDWMVRMKEKGASIELVRYENAAHGILQGPIDRKMLTYGIDNLTYSWTGSDYSAKDKLISDLVKTIELTKSK
jgi:poly(3-hydroxybutyrate) depolymerase